MEQRQIGLAPQPIPLDGDPVPVAELLGPTLDAIAMRALASRLAGPDQDGAIEVPKFAGPDSIVIDKPSLGERERLVKELAAASNLSKADTAKRQALLDERDALDLTDPGNITRFGEIGVELRWLFNKPGEQPDTPPNR